MRDEYRYADSQIDPSEVEDALMSIGWTTYFVYTAYWLAGLTVRICVHGPSMTWMAVYQEITACQTGSYGTWIAETDQQQDAIHRVLEIGPVPEYLRISDPRRVLEERVYQHQRGEN
jgi:hypothetical protein